MNKWSNWWRKLAAPFFFSYNKSFYPYYHPELYYNMRHTIQELFQTMIYEDVNCFQHEQMHPQDPLFFVKKRKGSLCHCGANSTLFVHMQHYCKFTKGIDLARQQCNTTLIFGLPLLCPSLRRFWVWWSSWMLKENILCIFSWRCLEMSMYLHPRQHSLGSLKDFKAWPN